MFSLVLHALHSHTQDFPQYVEPVIVTMCALSAAADRQIMQLAIFVTGCRDARAALARCFLLGMADGLGGRAALPQDEPCRRGENAGCVPDGIRISLPR